MKRLLNTLYVTTQGAYLTKEGETVVVKSGDDTLVKLPVHNLGSIVCFGQVMSSPALMGFCAESGVSISFMTEYGRFLAKVQGPVSGNVLLRREQYRRADNCDETLKIARAMLTAKFSNCRTVLRRMLRDHSEVRGGVAAGKFNIDAVSKVADRLGMSIGKLQRVESLEEIRGVEGDAAHSYFGVFDNLIIAQKEEFYFRERSRRPPMDNVNCLLSFLYTIVLHDIRSACEAVGLDPAVGYIHRDKPGRPGLALDLLEEFRPYLADRLVVSLINLGQVRASGFRKQEAGGVLMDDETRKAVLIAYQKRKQEELTHPFLNEKVAVGLLFHVQAMLLARYIRQDLDGYPPFIWK
ncbi:type I-C CRISPR-associated endonuclease Cas1c [Candidatus Magnetominusculus xianensis]|uniref:CRISPR-associated endonuclease Cas1 n=1 Tax=Candidatus Magnetominusculus xianensis TaxID=1748249 RepID=A0ABR5SDV1_9BACT|nr:type I-C CRISPR-associated endonuclease Cas1c [Candidatus Magnetominusculus xianensis]KWT83498.1 CRISPR-associated protein Cas1 [Candidatus Magnetominusculus xianensis]MBF0404138.1 type I-C CRISPR-associated endonuclease Cas1 [Nitrospirota bacterium]